MTATAARTKTEQTGVVESDLAEDTPDEEQLEVPKPVYSARTSPTTGEPSNAPSAGTWHA